MSDQSHLYREQNSAFRRDRHSGAGALTSSSNDEKRVRAAFSTPPTEDWVNEGGSVAPVVTPRPQAEEVFDVRL